MKNGLKDSIEKEVLSIIIHSPVPEDLPHALNTRKWLLKIVPEADETLQLAALSHDIERARASKRRKISRDMFNHYDGYKRAHCIESAKIMSSILKRFKVDRRTESRILFLIKNHEFGVKGSKYANALKVADSISFFDVCLPLYYEREGADESLKRMRWGWKRLSHEGKEIVSKFEYSEPILNYLMKKVKRNFVSRSLRCSS